MLDLDRDMTQVLTVFLYDVMVYGCCVLDGRRERALVQQPVFNGCTMIGDLV